VAGSVASRLGVTQHQPGGKTTNRALARTRSFVKQALINLILRSKARESSSPAAGEPRPFRGKLGQESATRHEDEDGMAEIEAIIETGIYVDDLGRAEAFYRDVLGLTVIGKEVGRHVFFRVGQRNVLLAFNSAATLKGDVLPAHGAQGPGHFALGISAADLDAWRERLQSQGIAIEKEMQWPRGGRSLYFRDPAGNSVELITPGCWGLPSGW
jgi:catechol 2,3-dioxygenase-like lactoylglutathione lyase family enzyme